MRALCKKYRVCANQCNPDSWMLTSGVTTVIETASSGAQTVLHQKQMVIDQARVHLLAFLNLVANGLDEGKERTDDQAGPQYPGIGYSPNSIAMKGQMC